MVSGVALGLGLGYFRFWGWHRGFLGWFTGCGSRHQAKMLSLSLVNASKIKEMIIDIEVISRYE